VVVADKTPKRFEISSFIPIPEQGRGAARDPGHIVRARDPKVLFHCLLRPMKPNPTCQEAEIDMNVRQGNVLKESLQERQVEERTVESYQDLCFTKIVVKKCRFLVFKIDLVSITGACADERQVIVVET